MNANFRVVLDACVLANFGLCDLFLTLAETPRHPHPPCGPSPKIIEPGPGRSIAGRRGVELLWR